jgi:hypothetical protein
LHVRESTAAFGGCLSPIGGVGKPVPICFAGQIARLEAKCSAQPRRATSYSLE